MAKYNGPKTKICRKFGEPVIGNPKRLTKHSNPPGQHGQATRKKNVGEYGLQLKEKQKAKYTYGVLEKQFRNLFIKASRMKGASGENLIRLLESRLDNVIYRLGFTPTRPSARQLVSHKHIAVNGQIVNIPSYQVKPGDILELKQSSKSNQALIGKITGKKGKLDWLDWDQNHLKGTFLNYPDRDNVPENIREQLIVELYSK